MKKQIFILVLLVAATFASVSKSYGQASNPPTCVGNALHPAIGQQYAYKVSIPDTPGFDGDGTFQWWVTQDVSLLTGTPETNGTDFTYVATGNYNTATAGDDNVSITWNSTALGSGNYYLVIKYAEANSTATGTCTPNNVKVMLITPQNTFWLKIENASDADGTAGGSEVCSPDVESATINTTTDPGEVEYIYGVSKHYVKISANGYTGNFTPTLQLGDLFGDAEYTSVTWSSGSESGTFTESSTAGIWESDNEMPSLNTYNPGDATADPAVLPSWGNGQSIIVTIEITHNHHEGLEDMPVAIAIDGSFLNDETPVHDIAGGTCDEDDGYEDTITQTVKARPTVSESTPALVPDPSTED